jgi:hypothetical protein
MTCQFADGKIILFKYLVSFIKKDNYSHILEPKLLLIMRKSIKTLLLGCTLVAMTLSYSSCATVFGGEVTNCQRTKPSQGEPARKLRAGAMVADILLFWPGLIVDFATKAIYKPCNK